jgi:two-component system OmpR family sensor kinase
MSRGAHPLRRRLVVTAIGLVLLITTALAVISALALRSTLLDDVDSQLLLASDRARQEPAPSGDDGREPGGPPGGSRIPPGQAAGTIGVYHGDSNDVDAGYVDDRGEFQALTTEQLEPLDDLPRDGEIYSVELPGLGDFHAVSTVTRHGDPVVTAISTADAAATVGSYVVLEIGLGAAGIALAAVVGTVLVRRALRPLDHVAAAAARVAEVPLDRGAVHDIPRVESSLTDERTEVGQVGSAFNRMIEHVETALAARHDSEMQVRRFVADASHELRTPLASIRGYAELVRRSPDFVPPETMHAIGRVESEAGRMSALVDDLLLLARLDAGRPLDRHPVDVTPLIVDAAADAHAAGPEHHWRLDLAEGAEPLVVLGDEARLRQVLANLLGNARVHTPAGTQVTVSGRLEGDHAVIRVRDDGPGIPAGLRPSLFQRFSRADTARSRTGGSTGLGLAIAQAIMHAHGGSISVDSHTADETPTAAGSTFTIRLPASPDPPAIHR